MQSLISTFSQNSLILIFFFLKVSVFSLKKVAFGNKTKNLKRALGQKFTRNAQICCFVSKCNFCNFLSLNLCGFDPGTKASMPSLLCRSQISIGSQFGQYIPTVVHTVRELQLWSKEIEWRHPSTKGSYCVIFDLTRFIILSYFPPL